MQNYSSHYEMYLRLDDQMFCCLHVLLVGVYMYVEMYGLVILCLYLNKFALGMNSATFDVI